MPRPNNRLSKRIELKDVMVSPFYICLDKKCRYYLINKALNKYTNFKILAKEIKCNHYTLRHFKYNEEKYIKAEFLNKLLRLIDVRTKDIEKNVLYVKRGCSNRRVKIQFPIKLGSELSLLMSKAFGDGGIASDWRFHYTNNQMSLINEVIDTVKNYIGENKHTLNNRLTRNIYDLKFSSVIGFILNFIGAPKGKKIDQEYSIPKWIILGDKKIKSFFLRGLFDDESTVDVKNKRIIIAFGRKEVYKKSLEGFLNDIKQLLCQFNIYAGNIKIQEKYDNKIILRFGIYKKENFDNFKKFIGFTHQNKRKALNNLIDSYIDIHKTKKAILKSLNGLKKPLTIIEIARLNNIKRDAAKSHLYDMLRENEVIKMGIKPTKWLKIT